LGVEPVEGIVQIQVQIGLGFIRHQQPIALQVPGDARNDAGD